MESEMDMEDFSNETNETDDENSDVEITFGPWPPFPSKPDCDDQDPINVESGDSDGLSEHCDEEQDSMESEGLVDVCNVEEVEDYATNDDIINHRVDDATNDDIINQCEDEATNDDIINQCVDEATNDDIINQCVDEATNDDIINQCVDEATNDGIINQCVDKLDESETVDTIGQLNMDNSNEDVEFNFEHACQEIGLDVPEFIKYDENKSDTEIITNNDIQSDSSVVSDIHEEAMIETSSPTESDNVISKCVGTDHINSDVSDDNEQTRPSAERDDVIRNCVETDRMNSDVSDNNEQISSPTESDYVISTCVPSESKEITSISLNSDVIDKLSETPTVTVKEEPVSDDYSDTEHTESAKDDNLFVSTEQGKMFLRSVATEPLSNNENGPKELDTDLILKELIVKKPGLCRDKSERFQKISKKLNVLKLKKMHYKESAQDKPAPMPGRIIGHDLSLVRGKRPDEFTPYQSLGHPVPKKLKLIKLSQNLEHDSTKIRKLQEHGTATITRKQRVISLARNLSPSSNDDMVTGDKVLNSLRVKPAGDTATTQDDGKVDLSLVKTEPLDYTEQDQGTSAPDSKVGETSSTSWIKKEPATEEKHFTETDKETNMPVPVKLIRNKLVNSVRSDSGVEDQEAKPPSTIVVGGKSICLQGGQKQMMYALPVGNQSITGMGDGVKQKKIVRVIKLSNTKSGPTVIPLTSNFKLVRIPKPLTSSPCQGEEIALSSLPRQNQISLLNNPTGKSTCEKDKNRMLKKIDGIIKENLKVIKKDWHPAKTQGYGSTQDLNVDHQKQQARPKFREEFDKDTGKTSVFLMPQKEEETIINKNIIYRYDRTRKTAAKKNQKVIDSSLKTVPLKTKALAVRPKVQVPLPGVTQSNGPDVTNKDPTACNKILDIAKAVMVKDAIMQTDPSQENIETDQGDSKETPGTVGTEKVGEVSRGTEKVGEVSRGTEKVGEVSGKTDISGGTGEVSSNHSEDTDLLMDVEDVDFINLDTKMAPDPLTVPRLRWKKSWRKTASVGVNTYIRTKVEDPVTPLHHEYVLPVDKPKPPRTASDIGKRKYYRHQWEKLKNLQKVVRRKNFLKTKQWEYECNVGKLKQKLEERKKIDKEAVQKDISQNNLEASEEAVQKDISQKNSEASESEVSEQIQQAGKEKSDILNQKVNEGKDDVKRDDGSSESSKNHVVKPGASIHSSCRIETQQKQAMENADMSKFFERVEQKLGDVQPVQVGYGQVITYMTDSSDEEWKEVIGGVSTLNTKNSVNPTTESKSKEDGHIFPGEDTEIQERDGVDLYLMCNHDNDLPGEQIYLMCNDDLDLDNCTPVIQQHYQCRNKPACEEDIGLETTNDINDIQKRVIKNDFVENLNFEKDADNNEAYPFTRVGSLSPRNFGWTISEPLKSETMTALSLQPVTMPTQAAEELSTTNRIPTTGSTKIRRLSESMSLKVKGGLQTTRLMTERSSKSRSLETEENSQLRSFEVKQESPPRSSEAEDRFPYPRSSEVKDRFPFPRSSKAEDRFPYPRSSEADDRFQYPWSSDAENRFQYPRSSEGEDRFQYARSSEVEDRFEYARSSEAEDKFQYARSSEAEDRFQYARSSEAEDRFQYPRSSEADDRFQYPRSSEAENRFQYPRSSEAEDRFQYPRSSEAEHRFQYPRSSEVEDIFQYARSSEVEDRFQYARSSEAEHRFQYPKSSEAEDRFQYPRSSEVEDRFQYHRTSEAEDRFPYPKSSEAEDRFPYLRTLEGKGRLSHPKSLKDKERSPINQTLVDIETCVVRETIHEVSPTLKNYQSPKSENMTEECVEMNKELVSRSQELWTQKPTNTDSPNIGLQRKDENNNDFIPFDSLTDNKYEYITTDDFLYTEPLNLCIKQPNSTIGVEKSDDKVRRPAVPTTIDNSNFSKAPSFSEDCAVPMSPVYGSHTVAAAKGTLSHTDQVTTRENKGFFYGNQYYIRSGPKQKEFDENANCIEDPHAFSRLEGSSTVTRLEDTNAASIPVGSTATGFDGPNTATQAGFPLTVSRPEDLPAATLQHTYPYTRCESLNTTKGVGGQITHTRSEDSSRVRETCKQNPNKIIVKFSVPRHLDEGKLTNPKLEKIQTIFRSDGAVDQQGSRSTCDEMDKDGTPDKAAGRPNSEVTRESQAMSREKFPNNRNSLNTVGNIGPEPHEKMLMHMMYTQHLLGTDGNGNMCSKPQEPSGRMLQCALDSGDIQKPQEPSGRMLQTALDLGDIHKPQEPSGRRLQCSYPLGSVEDHQQYNSVPLDLSCNKYRSTPAASVRVPVHHLHPKFESSIVGVRPMSDTFVSGIQKEVESFKSNIWPRYGIINEVPHVRKLNSDNFMSAGVLTNLRMPDNVEELLCQRAVPRPGCIAYPLPPRRLLLNPLYSRVAGVGTEAWKAATYQHVPDTNPSAACRTYTNRTFAAPGPVQLQDCMANMFGNNIEFDNGIDSVRESLSMKQRSDTTKSYKLLSQMLDGGDAASETNQKTQTRDCPTPSVKSGTFCTNFHVHPIPQTFPAAAHRHFIRGSSEAYSHSQPPNLLGISSVLQQCGSDVIQRKNTPEISHQLPSASTRGLFRPYMNENETLTKTVTNSGPRNSEVVCPPRKMLSEDVRKTLGRHLIGRASTKKMFTSSNGNSDPQPESSDDRAYFPPAGNAGNMQKFRISEGNVSHVTMSDLGQINFKGDEGNIFRHPNDNNGNLFHGNQRQGLDCNKTAHALAEPRMISVKFPHEPGLSRFSHINGKNVFPENRNEDSSCNGNDRGMPHRQYVEYTVASPDPANIVEFADKSLAVAQGLSDRPPIDQNSHNWDTVYKNFCCKCWSRGKCRSCVCSKIGCHNCRNPLCQFLNVTNPKKALSRHKKVKGKSCTRSKSRITKQPTSPEYRSQASAELVDRTHGQTGYSQNTSEVCELSGPMGTGTRVNEVLRGSGQTEQGTLMDYKLAEGRNDLPDFMEKIESVVEDETEVSNGLDDMVVKQNEVVEELSGKNDLDSAIHEREKLEQKLAFDQRILLEAKTTVDKNYWRSLHAFDKEMSDNEHKIITQAKVSQKQTTAEGSHMDQSFSCKTQFDAIPSSAVLPPERVASVSVKSKSEGVTKGIIDKTSKIKFKNKKDKGKKNRTNVKKKSTSNSFVHQSLDRNNNIGNDCTQTLKRMHNNDDIENEVSDVIIPKLSRSSNDTPEHVDENNNVNSLESNSLRDDIDANNNDTCFPKSGTASTSSEISTEHELVRTTTKMKKSCYQSKRKITKIKKGSVENVKRTITGEGQSFNEDIDNAMETASAATLDKEYKTPPKKGRPRTRPPPKQLPPKMLIKLEEHTDKYEVTQFTSFHKKDRNIEVGLKSFERFTCRLCSGMYQYNTPDRASMEDHLAQHLSGRLTCPDCGKTFSQAIHVREHRQKIHRTADFTCEICAKQFFTNTTLKRHLCKAHGHKLFNCKQCTERFSSVEQVKNHVYEVHGGEATKCEKCGVISLSSKAAAVHAKSKMCLGREESNVPCPHCSQILSVSQMAHHVKRIHLRVHTYKCSQCPYTTLARTALNNHMMMHQGVHPFRCELCPFSCVKSYQLSSHMRTHTGVKPYRCDQCSYAAAWNVQLKDHMRAHVSPNSVLCDECGILFKDDRCLNLHNKKIHKSKEEVKVAKYRKVKEKGTRRRRLKAAKEVKDEQPSNLDSVDTQKENSVLSCQEGQAVRQYDGAL